MRERRSGGAGDRGFKPRPDLASSAGNSDEESEDENGGKKIHGVACQESRSVDRFLQRPSSLWTSDRTRGLGLSSDNYYKSSPLRKFFVILTYRQGVKLARCSYCNLAFMHWFYSKFLPYLRPISVHETFSGGEKMRNAIAATKVKMSGSDIKRTGTHTTFPA